MLGIYKLAEVSDVALAVSLHASNDALRDKLVPINRKYPIAELMAACHHYLKVLGEHRSITIEYTLMRGVNDSVAQAHELAKLLRDLRCKINLILQSVSASGYERPDDATVRVSDRAAELGLCRHVAHDARVKTSRRRALAELVGEVAVRSVRRYLARSQSVGGRMTIRLVRAAVADRRLRNGTDRRTKTRRSAEVAGISRARSRLPRSATTPMQSAPWAG